MHRCLLASAIEAAITCCRGRWGGGSCKKMFLFFAICNFSALLSSSARELALKTVTGVEVQQQQRIRRNDASKESLAVPQITAMLISTHSVSCDVIYLFTFFLAELPLWSWISRKNSLAHLRANLQGFRGPRGQFGSVICGAARRSPPVLLTA